MLFSKPDNPRTPDTSSANTITSSNLVIQPLAKKQEEPPKTQRSAQETKLTSQVLLLSYLSIE
jgi:hypothetical protein